ncbi:MAG: glycoside hydrolase family 88 protein [Prevotella sp.]|nr:glycoside hydrolase family 88 protein [Prevotella sp.]MBP3842904.1 glycoside hydrolase family 88 protein [Prevotella sp.]
MKKLISLCCLALFCLHTTAQTTAQDVLAVAQKANNYFMTKYADPTVPTNVKKIRPSSLWTRAVYYEGLMALQEIDPQQRYLDYATTWADFHKWTPRNGITTCDADDQCCAQTYVELLPYLKKDYKEQLTNVIANLDHQMQTPNTKKQTTTPKAKTSQNSLYGWWTWIDAIQMAMPLYVQIYKLTGDKKYLDHGMKMYRWSRNECGRGEGNPKKGLFNTDDGLWWRDADYVPPYKEPDGKDCYWSRGNGWVYAALVRCMNLLPAKSKEYKELKKDFMLMSEGLLKCQREDGFWNPSLVSTNYAMKETSGTALFLYGMAWGIRQGYLKADVYRPAIDRAWTAMVKDAVHHDGFLGWMQGTGKDPSAGQPLSYDKIPDFEDYGTGCFLLGATEYYKLLVKE